MRSVLLAAHRKIDESEVLSALERDGVALSTHAADEADGLPLVSTEKGTSHAYRYNH